MKKLLIPALLVVSAAFAPGLWDTVEFPDRACEIAQEVARPLLWHLWDQMLSHELARAAQPQARAALEPGLAPALVSDTVVCILFHVFLKHAFDGVVSAAEKNNTFIVSISQGPVRRTIGRGFGSILITRWFATGSILLRRSS
jgi:hypothetical protein